MNKILIGISQILVLILLIGGMSSCYKYEDVSITDVKSIKLLEFSSDGLKVESEVKISNPNNYSISVTDSKFNVYSKNRLIGTSRIENNVSLKKLTNEYHTVVFSSSYEDLAPNAAATLLTLTAMGGEEVNFKVDGFIEAKVYMLKKKFPVSFEDDVPLNFY